MHQEKHLKVIKRLMMRLNSEQKIMQMVEQAERKVKTMKRTRVVSRQNLQWNKTSNDLSQEFLVFER